MAVFEQVRGVYLYERRSSPSDECPKCRLGRRFRSPGDVWSVSSLFVIRSRVLVSELCLPILQKLMLVPYRGLLALVQC